MFRRFSVVNRVDIRSMGFASVLQIGDSNQIQTRARAIAVQRELPIYDAKEGHFAKYSLFLDTEISILKREQDIRMHQVHEVPFICVKSVEIVSFGNSGILHIGSTDNVYANARILQIRHYIEEEPFSEPSI
ncbi:spore germination protein GerPE [Bacillus sp. 165]|uniref:spore germination protein GerPE n=1 Tax=Bacillus sp. 165 TaxID=1529117 RepID=UPI001ADA53A2|nr:spore germination protein GerPE [Bacillus sp. 165]MBO9128701.1 spore germination protein GerPE [Bacillus sp. 165]